MSQIKTLTEGTQIIQDNLDYTLFSWSKQKEKYCKQRNSEGVILES